MKYQIISRKTRFSYVTIAIVIFSRVKITVLSSRVKICFPSKAHVVFHWCSVYHRPRYQIIGQVYYLALSQDLEQEQELIKAL